MDCQEVCLLEATQQEFSRSHHHRYHQRRLCRHHHHRYCHLINRKMITTDINIYFMITGNMMVVVHCLSVTFRTLNGPLPIYVTFLFRWNKKAKKS